MTILTSNKWLFVIAVSVYDWSKVKILGENDLLCTVIEWCELNLVQITLAMQHVVYVEFEIINLYLLFLLISYKQSNVKITYSIKLKE